MTMLVEKLKFLCGQCNVVIGQSYNDLLFYIVGSFKALFLVTTKNLF